MDSRAWKPAAVLAALVLLTACATTRVVPPADPASPVTVFLLDHGDHSSLVLPAGDGGVVRYAYGDWDWFVRGRTGPGDALAAVLWPTDAALGRRRLPGPPTPESVRRQVLVNITDLYRLEVAAARAGTLRQRLEGIYADGREQRVYSEGKDLFLVPHPRPYTATNTSNTMTARWLETLGCRVEGTPAWSDWRVVPAGRSGAVTP